MVLTRSTPQRRKAACRTSHTGSLTGSDEVLHAAFRRCGPPGLDHDDRLGHGHLARRRKEGARVADRFHVHHDAGGPWIISQVVDQVTPADIEHRTYGDEGAEAHRLAQAPVQHRGTEGAALADEAYAARPGGFRGEGGIHPAQRHHHPKAIRADDAHAGAPRLRQHLLLEFDALRPRLPEAGGDDDGASHSGLCTFLDDPRHGGCGRGNHRQFHRFRHRGDVRIGLDPEHARTAGMDGKHGSAEGAGDQVAQDVAAYAARLLRGSDHGYASRREECVQGSLLRTQHVVRRMGDRTARLARRQLFLDSRAHECTTHNSVPFRRVGRL